MIKYTSNFVTKFFCKNNKKRDFNGEMIGTYLFGAVSYCQISMDLFLSNENFD
jgi:hypothetical protein